MATHHNKEDKGIIDLLRRQGKQVNHPADLDGLVAQMAGAKVVMLGEASHGTHEYYTWRSYLTKKLIREHGFHFIAVEGDWPDCYRVNRFIKQKEQKGKDAAEVLQSFDRWPTWMWANWEVVALCNWLHNHNQAMPEEEKKGFYGLDVYSLWDSLAAVRTYLQDTDSAALEHAEKAFRCFAPYRDDETAYAYAAQAVPQRCYNEVAKLLQQLKVDRSAASHDDEQVFSAEQNALASPICVLCSHTMAFASGP